jgi:hypothetical protein
MTKSQDSATDVVNRPHSQKKPIFGVASWILPGVAWLVANFIVRAAAAAQRARGDWLPGLHEAIASIFVIALCAFACGVIAIVRHERYRWLGLPPALSRTLCSDLLFPDFLSLIFERKP